MVPVRLAPLRAALEENDPACESATDFVVAELKPAGPAAVDRDHHACALPHRVVLHVHCVETIAWAVQADARKSSPRFWMVWIGFSYPMCGRACR